MEIINKEMCQSNKWMMRKTFIYFCKYIVQVMPCDFFKQHYIKLYMETSKDKVSNVRREFVYAMLNVKPYFDK